MAKFRYKNTSTNTIVIINQGQVAPGDIITLDDDINSPDLQKLQDVPSNPDTTTPVQQPPKPVAVGEGK